jgi:hypothetical protein
MESNPAGGQRGAEFHHPDVSGDIIKIGILAVVQE